jgi:hypothetical protein
MKICKIGMLYCLFGVAGCGGSADLHTLSNSQPQNGQAAEITLPVGVRLIETLFDGQSAVRFFVPSEPAVYTGIVEDQIIASELYNGSLNDIKDIKSSKVGGRFYVEREALSSGGQDVLINVAGLDLTADGSEYASRLYIEIDGGHKGYLISGTPVEVLPTAQVTYSGFIEIIIVDGATTRQEGNFNLDIDFNKAIPNGVLSASTQDYAFAATNIQVDPKTAEFTTASAFIGSKGYEVNGVIYGTFAGAEGQGAAGVITSTGNAAVGYLGTFVGKR